MDGRQGPNATNPAACRLVLPVTYKPRLVWIFVAGCLGFVLGILPRLWLPMPEGLAMAVLVVAVLLCMAACERLTHWRAAAALQVRPVPASAGPAPWTAALVRWAERSVGLFWLGALLHPQKSGAGAAAQFVARQPGAPALVYLSAPAQPEAPLPEPLQTPIEPTLLSRATPEIWERFETIRHPTRVERLSQVIHAYGRSRGARSFMFVSLGLALVGFGVLAVQMLGYLRLGTLPPGVHRYSGPILACLALMLLVQYRHSIAWYVVPGGLLIAESPWYRATHRLHRFTPSDSVLLYWPESQQLAVAQATGPTFARMVDPTLAQVALAAWLSPLPCPPVEQFSDLR